MRKFILALVALVIVLGARITTAPANAAVAKHQPPQEARTRQQAPRQEAPQEEPKKNPACMTKGEWNRLGEGMTRKQVKNVVGSWGKVTDRYDNSDGTFYIAVDYRQCNGSTTFVSFETEVTYGA